MKTKDYVVMLIVAFVAIWLANNVSFVKSVVG